MEKKKFAVVIFNLEHKIFIIYIAAFIINLNNKTHLLKKT